jgi:hypothetical protein
MIHLLFFSLLGQVAFDQPSEVGHGLLAVTLLITEQPVDELRSLALGQPLQEGRSHHRQQRPSAIRHIKSTLGAC